MSKKTRWRDAKKGIVSPELSQEKQPELSPSAPVGDRVKAFITDMFMIMMPIAYITTYVIMDGKDDFQGSSIARWGISVVYGAIVVLFWSIKGQTPGYKAYDLTLVDAKSGTKPSFIKAFLRYISFLFAATTIVGVVLPFIRKDKKTLQDLLTNTYQKSLKQ